MTRKKPSAPPVLSALQVEELPIEAIHEYANNSRMHTVEQIELIARSITEYGWTNPILIDADSEIIAGHARLQAARNLGMATVPTIRLGHLTPTQKRALVIADNKIAITGTQWDFALLREEIAALDADGFNLELTGFDAAELGKMFPDKVGGLTDPDDVPAPSVQTVSVAGDVWIMGSHRVMCGDSTNPQHVEKLMAGDQADLCFTSPPYGQQRDYASGGIGDWDKLMQGVFAILPMKPAGQVLVNLGMVHRENEWIPYWDQWIAWMRRSGWRSFGWYVWDQGPGMAGDWAGRLAPSHEVIFHFNKEDDPAWNGRLNSAHMFVFHFNKAARKANKTKEKLAASIKVHGGGGQRKKDGKLAERSNLEASLQTHKIPDSVIRVGRQHGRFDPNMDHPAVFPVELVSEIMATYSDPGAIAYEPFCGSGTQIISAQQEGRSCRGMELAPIYTDVCVKRWQNFTGQEAVLDGDGRTFSEVAARRDRSAA